MNRLPETVNNKFTELFAIIDNASDDLKMASAEAVIVGNFSQASSSLERCQRLLSFEQDIKLCLSNFESNSQIQTGRKTHHKRLKRHTRKTGGLMRVKITNKVIEQSTIAETFVKTLEIFGFDNVAKLNKKLTSIPLLSRSSTNSYQNQKFCNGWYITTHCNLQTATKVLEDIGKELHIPITVEAIAR